MKITQRKRQEPSPIIAEASLENGRQYVGQFRGFQSCLIHIDADARVAVILWDIANATPLFARIHLYADEPCDLREVEIEISYWHV